MLDALAEAVTIKTLLGMAGAIPGGLRAYALARAQHTRTRAISDALIGMVFAASVAEMMTPEKYPSTALLVGMLAGLTGGRALDALFELVPEVVRTVAIGWARKASGEQGELKVRQTTGWGDLTPRADNPDGGKDANF